MQEIHELLSKFSEILSLVLTGRFILILVGIDDVPLCTLRLCVCCTSGMTENCLPEEQWGQSGVTAIPSSGSGSAFLNCLLWLYKNSSKTDHKNERVWRSNLNSNICCSFQQDVNKKPAASDLSFPPLPPKRLPLLCIPCRRVTRPIHPSLGSCGPIGAVVSANSGYVPAHLCFDMSA